MGAIAEGAENSLGSETSASSMAITQDVLQWRQKHELLEQSIQKYVPHSLLHVLRGDQLTFNVQERVQVLPAC